MARKKEITATGYHDQTGVWHDLPKEDKAKIKEEKKIRAKLEKVDGYKRMQEEVRQQLLDHERRLRGELYEDEYAKCPDCLDKLPLGYSTVNPKPENYCFKHNWVETGYEWLIINGHKVGCQKSKDWELYYGSTRS